MAVHNFHMDVDSPVVAWSGNLSNVTESYNTSTVSYEQTSFTTSLIFESSTFTDLPNVTDVPLGGEHLCVSVLFRAIGSSHVRVWDVMILVPNALFFIYLMFKCFDAVTRLGRNTSQIFGVIFALVFIAICIGIVRCAVSMAVNTANTNISVVDRVMWLILKFFLLATELSVVIFCLLFGHLDSRTSVRRVILVTFSMSLAYSTIQGILEFVYENDAFHGDSFTLFGHGGMIFWFVSSTFLSLVYTTICCLPFTRLSRRFALPTKRSFYLYCLLLACLDATQAVGSMLLYCRITQGMCVVDVTAFIYFTGFAPLVYAVFLQSFFVARPMTINFSYRRQNDEEDDVNLPRQPAAIYGDDEDQEGRPEGATIDDESYDSSHFGLGSSPLYVGLAARPELSVNQERYRDIKPVLA